MTPPLFTRYIGIDYSGAETPNAGLKGLRVYVATTDADPTEAFPPPGASKYWTRRGVAEWLLARLAEDIPTVVGIDHGFSFPLAYFERHGLPLEWHGFLEDFHRHWPTDVDDTYVDFVRSGACGLGSERGGETRWRRVTERRAGGAKSVFHFDVQGSVAKSTHSGLPWLLRLRRELSDRVHFWPFDGWEMPASRSAIVEVYPALWSRSYDRELRTADQHDAYSVAQRMREADRDGTLSKWLTPELADEELAAARVEGWILGVGAEAVKPPLFEVPPSSEREIAVPARIATAAAKPGKLRVVRQASRRPKAADALIHRFLVTLGDTDPLVWRRIEVPERYSFWDLHVAIQDAMGRLDYHLHEFTVVHPKTKRLVRIGIPDDEFMDEEPRLAGWQVRVSQYVDWHVPPMLYSYDFGDDWRHTVFHEGTSSAEDDTPYPRCVAGARRCPPEDCGGTHGYREFLEAVRNRRHPEHADMLRWAGGSFDPAAFDPASVRFDDPQQRWGIAFASSD